MREAPRILANVPIFVCSPAGFVDKTPDAVARRRRDQGGIQQETGDPLHFLTRRKLEGIEQAMVQNPRGYPSSLISPERFPWAS